MTAAPAVSGSMTPVPFTIDEVVVETHDCFTMTLSPPEGAFTFSPGQFNMLYVFGVGEVPISISGDPTKPERVVHTVRAVGTVTKAMQALKAGQAVGVRGPFGTTWPVEKAEGKDLVFVAGGIGLAPLRPAIYHALTHRDRYGKVFLAYGTRTPKDILFDEQLIGWRSRFDLDVEVTVDRGSDTWRGKTGVVTRLLQRADFDPQNAIAMTCGPEIMMRFAARELMKQGMPAESLYVTLERNMQCAVAQCGHCQMGPELICRDGPVYRFDEVQRLFTIREV